MYVFLFFTLILNSFNAIAYNVADLVIQLTNAKFNKPSKDDWNWFSDWGGFTHIFFEFIMTCNGIGFLIIFGQIAKMRQQ